LSAYPKPRYVNQKIECEVQLSIVVLSFPPNVSQRSKQNTGKIIMDDCSIAYFINNQYIEITTIHLLIDKDKFIIAVNWYEDNEQHFKMFKKLNVSQVISFSNNLKHSWSEKINIWLNSPKIPLKLKVI